MLDVATGQPVAERVADRPDLPNRILAGNVPVFAHTSPGYHLRDGRKRLAFGSTAPPGGATVSPG